MVNNVTADLDKLISFHEEHQALKAQVKDLSLQVAQYKTQLKLTEALITIYKEKKNDLKVANLIIDLYSN